MIKTGKLSRQSLNKQDVMDGLRLLAPGLLIIGILSVLPVLFTFILSFTDATLSSLIPKNFVWFKNYIAFLQSSQFWAATWRTVYFTVVSVGLELIIGLAIATLIHSKPAGWRFLRTSLIIPWAVPTIVNGAMWRWIYNADYGALNGILYSLGLIEKYQAWLTKPFTALNLVIIADIWHSVPFIAIILQAALAVIPHEVEEAAAVDGANAWQRFLFIRLPLLHSAILVALIVRTVEAFRVFDIIYVITQGGPAFGTVTISYLTYLESFTYGKMGSGSALSFLISVFTLVMALIYIKFLYRPESRA
ncbi:MAG TPA: sugar ABC transporter permease [Bellilinea sp.]|nr:sugar ABC transporter permease [Bellilinea sp.]